MLVSCPHHPFLLHPKKEIRWSTKWGRTGMASRLLFARTEQRSHKGSFIPPPKKSVALFLCGPCTQTTERPLLSHLVSIGAKWTPNSSSPTPPAQNTAFANCEYFIGGGDAGTRAGTGQTMPLEGFGLCHQNVSKPWFMGFAGSKRAVEVSSRPFLVFEKACARTIFGPVTKRTFPLGLITIPQGAPKQLLKWALSGPPSAK